MTSAISSKPLNPHNVLVLFSGGLDSTALLSCYASKVYSCSDVGALSLFYGQRHGKEIEAASLISDLLDVDHRTIGIPQLGFVFGENALTGDGTPVPHGHYAAETMKETVVANRNAVMVSIAAAFAAARGYGTVALAVHAGDHPIYQDCRPEFIEALDRATQLSCGVRVAAPFVEKTKADIVREGVVAYAAFAASWSCYEGGDRHCGRCGTCVERCEAFHLAKVPDPTDYAVRPTTPTTPTGGR